MLFIKQAGVDGNGYKLYSKLVRDDDDIIGMVAYGIYKKHKIEFIESVKKPIIENQMMRSGMLLPYLPILIVN